MSRKELERPLYNQTPFPPEIIDMTMSFVPMRCLFLAEKISIPTSDDGPDPVHWSAGTFFSKRKAILYFSKIGSYNRILRARRIGDETPFRYQILGTLLEPDRKIEEKELTTMIDIELNNKSHFKGMIGHIRRHISDHYFLKEECPFGEKHYQHLFSWITPGNCSWKYTVKTYHDPKCNCGCKATDFREKIGLSNLAHFGWEG
jgi:hypothetical protein